ncbi:MAG: 7-carboxy-7-deazaguanine synthase QueE [Alphaproteobacteria bacterium]
MTTQTLRLARGADDEPEIFLSVQGEGARMGHLRAFIRLSGCNLHCAWCDTPYTWNWTETDFPHAGDRPGAPNKFSMKEETRVLAVPVAAARLLALDAPGLVITGGEPIIQQRGVESLIRAVRGTRPDLFVEIETNGTLAPSDALMEAVDQFNVSPKLAHSGNDLGAALQPEVLARYARTPKAVFKFVATGPGDLEAIGDLTAALGLPGTRVYVMPEGTTSDALRDRARDLIDPVIARGWGFSDRLHIHLYGDKRST